MPTQSGNIHSSSGNAGNTQSSSGSAGHNHNYNGGSAGSVGSNTILGGLNSASIAQPALQHRFTMHIEGTPKTFDEQCIAVAFNMVAKELVIGIEQSATNSIREHAVIQDIISSPNRVVTLETVDSSGNVIDTIKFRDSSIISHMVEYNYASAGAVVHIVTLSYNKIDLTGNVVANNAFASAMSIVGRP